MQAVPDVLWVFLALPLLLALGLGLALLTSSDSGQSRVVRAQVLTLACAAGLLVDYGLGMLLPRLLWVLCFVVAAAAASVTWALLRHRTALGEVAALGWPRWLLAIAILLAVSVAILFEPLNGWDARSIWFFAAKRIFYGDGLGHASDWSLPAYGFSHADYPKLLPLLAAQFAQAWGTWNEYIPKASLLLLLAPVLLGLLGLAQSFRTSVVFLAAGLLLSTRDALWNGYADTYMSLYGVMGLLYLARWMATSQPLPLAVGGAFLGVALNLKNEGTLVLVCTVTAVVFWQLLARRQAPWLQWRRWPIGVWLVLALPWIGFVGWALTRHQWQLANDLQLGAGSLQRIWQRLAQGQADLIFHALVVRSDAGRAAVLLAVTAALAASLRIRIAPSAWFPAAVATLYGAGLFAVYLATPSDLAWHLATSVDRTVLLAAFGFMGSTFLILEAMEAPGPDGSRSPATIETQT